MCFSDIDSYYNHAGYVFVSPTEIVPLAKSQQPRKQTNQKHFKARILTPEKLAIKEERKNKQKVKTIRTKSTKS